MRVTGRSFATSLQKPGCSAIAGKVHPGETLHTVLVRHPKTFSMFSACIGGHYGVTDHVQIPQRLHALLVPYQECIRIANDDDDDKSPSTQLKRTFDPEDDETTPRVTRRPLLLTPEEAAADPGLPGVPMRTVMMSSDKEMPDVAVSGPEQENLVLPTELLENIALMTIPKQLPTLVRSSATFFDIVFSPAFVKNYKEGEGAYTAFEHAFDTFQMFFVGNMWPLLSLKQKAEFLDYAKDWQFMWLYKRFPGDVGRRALKVRIQEAEEERTFDFGSPPNALIVARLWAKRETDLMADTMFDEVSGILPRQLQESDMSAPLIYLVLARPTGGRGVRSPTQDTNMPAARLLQQYDGTWNGLLSSATADGLQVLLDHFVRYPMALMEFSSARWFPTMVEYYAEKKRSFITRSYFVGHVWPAALTRMPLFVVKRVLELKPYNRPDVLFTYAILHRPDIAAWMIQTKMLARGNKNKEQLRRAWLLAQDSEFGRQLVAADPRFKQFESARASRTEIRSEQHNTRRAVWYDYDEAEIMDSGDWDAAMQFADFTPSTKQAADKLLGQCLTSLPRMARATYEGKTEFVSAVSEADIDRFNVFPATNINVLSTLVLSSPRIVLPVKTLQQMVERAYTEPSFVYLCMGELISRRQGMDTASTIEYDRWLATLATEWLRTNTSRAGLYFRNQMQHAMRALLRPDNDNFPFSLVDWRAWALLQNDARYYCFAILDDLRGFDPSVANNTLTRAAYARGQLAFVRMWLRDNRVKEEFLRTSAGKRELATIVTLSESMEEKVTAVPM